MAADATRWYTRIPSIVSAWLAKLDRSSHGYVPFFCWLLLLFGGIWFPATPILDHIFNDKTPPVGVLFGTSDRASEGSAPVDSSSSADTTDQTVAEPSEKPASAMHFSTALLLLPFCLVFWSWTNIGLLCVMASAMGEVNRCAEQTGAESSYRTACTRAFFVYLFVLLNELAVAGSLTAGNEIQGSYTRIAILASLLGFVASYRPNFYLGLVSRFSASQDGNDPDDNGERPPQPGPAPTLENETRNPTGHTVQTPDAVDVQQGLRPPRKDFG